MLFIFFSMFYLGFLFFFLGDAQMDFKLNGKENET